MHFITDQHIDFRQLSFILEDILAVSDDYFGSWVKSFIFLQASCELSDYMLVISIVNEVSVHLVDKLLVRNKYQVLQVPVILLVQVPAEVR